MIKFDKKNYIVLNIGETEEQEVLLDFLNYSREHYQIDSEIIVLLTPQKDGFTYENDNYHIVRTPKFIHTNGFFATYNKVASIKYLVETCEFDDDCKLFFVDPDMIFINHFDIRFSDLPFGKMIAQKWYGFSSNSSSRCSDLLECGDPENGWMYPFVINFLDLKILAEPLFNIANKIYPDTDDWMTDMYAFLHSAEEIDIEIELDTRLAVVNDWGIWERDTIKMIHYTQPIRLENEDFLWNKRVIETLVKPVLIPDYLSEIDKEQLSLFNKFV